MLAKVSARIKERCTARHDISIAITHTTNYATTFPCECLFLDVRITQHQSLDMYFQVDNPFMINITFIEGYVPYTESCTTNVVTVKDINHAINGRNATLIALCGYILLESVYTLSNKGLIVIDATEGARVNTLISYHIHTKGHSFRSQSPRLSHRHKIDIADRPCWIFYEGGIVSYLWYYNWPLPLGSAIEDTENIKFYPVYLAVHRFQCTSTYSTRLFIGKGLLPKIWMDKSDTAIYCSNKASYIVLTRHKYTTVLLKSLVRAHFSIKIKFHVSNEYHQVPFIRTPERKVSFVGSYLNFKLYYFVEGSLGAVQLNIERVAIDGYQRNVPSQWIHNLPHVHPLNLVDTKGNFYFY